MGILLAVIASAGWGSGDFVAGRTSAQFSEARILLGVNVLSILPAAIAATLLGGSPSTEDLLWGAAAGVFDAVGITFLFRALRIGPMSITAPISGVAVGAVPVAVGLLQHETISAIQVAGVVGALIPVAVLSRAATEAPEVESNNDANAGIRSAILGGVFIGFALSALHEVSAEAQLWPAVTLRLALVAAIVPWALRGGGALRPVFASRWVWLMGLLFLIGDGSYTLATTRDSLTVTGVIGAMGPAWTVVFALLFLREKLTRLRMAGLLLAATSVVSLAAG